MSNSMGASFLPAESTASRYWTPECSHTAKDKGSLTLNIASTFNSKGIFSLRALLDNPTETNSILTGCFLPSHPFPERRPPGKLPESGRCPEWRISSYHFFFVEPSCFSPMPNKPKRISTGTTIFLIPVAYLTEISSSSSFLSPSSR